MQESEIREGAWRSTNYAVRKASAKCNYHRGHVSLNLIAQIRPRRANAQRRLFDRHHRIRIDALREPGAGADDGVVADDRVAAQDGGVGVNDDLVLEGRVTLHAADDIAGGVAREGESAQGHALVKLHVGPDVAGFA